MVTDGTGAACLSVLVCVGLAATASFADSRTDPDQLATTRLERAFDSRFEFDVVEVVQLNVHGRSGSISRTVEMAIKRVDGNLRSVGFFTEPDYLRGTRLLMIENPDREDDFFIYMPSQKKVRRITTSQRSNAFMGTDLSYEDMERRYVEDFTVSAKPDSSVAGEKTYVIHAIPKYDSSYESVDFFVAKSDYAILEVRYQRAGSGKPWKVQRIPRSGIIEKDGYLIPTQIEVEDYRRRSRTVVEFGQIQVNPKIRDSLFSTAALEAGREILFSEGEFLPNPTTDQH